MQKLYNYLKGSVLLILIVVANNAFAQTTITGTVTDDTGPLPGVSISVNGTGTQTIANGKYSITASKGSILKFSFVGYFTKEVKVADQTVINVHLVPNNAELKEVVVTALGINKEKRSLGYASTTIKADELTKTAATNFATALYGKVPGMRIASAPGGATSGVSIQLRGVNSILNTSTPLIIMDGVPIHDVDRNNPSFLNGNRIGSNGLVDLNAEDIESISILKGASAAALYGSEANNGVILITTKNGKGTKGVRVDFNANYTEDKVAYLPDYQNVRGAGMPVQLGVYGEDANGFNSKTYPINGVPMRATVQGSLNFGPLFDGKPILSWDGVVRPYSAQKNNYDGLFQTAHNSNFNVAFSHATENSSTRFSLSDINTEGVSLGSHNQKITANLNSNFKLSKNYSVDVLVNFIHQDINNRPYSVNNLTQGFTGMMPRFDNGQWYLNKYKSSLGYKYVIGSNQSLTPNENIMYPNYRTDILDFVWNVKENKTQEISNRLIGSVTNNWQIINNLNLRARLSADLTGGNTINKNSTAVPTIFGYDPNTSGSFGLLSNSYNIIYGEVLLTYDKKITSDIGMSFMGGYNAERDFAYNTSVSTNGGLTADNNFDIAASYLTPTGSGSQTFLSKDALFGTINANYKKYLYIQGTLRQDRTSTMNPSQNTFVYPSVNSGFVFSDAFHLPSFISFGKLRASWGIVGSYPIPYQANIAYNQGTLGVQRPGTGALLTTTTRDPFGNDAIRPEKKHEYEFGLETKFFQNRVNLDVTYYNARIVDQLLNLALPQSAGASAVLTNIGELSNKGFELAISGTPILTGKFSWETGLNFASNQNKVVKLSNGASELIHQDFDGNAAVLKSVVGQPMGDFYAHPIATDSRGQKIVGDDGTYVLDGNKMQKYGNAMPKAVGGYYNTFNYKSFTLELYADFRFGGSVMPSGLYWMTGRGLTKESLNHMDKTHGGLSYYLDGNGKGIQTSAGQGPAGQTVYNDGMLMPGVTANGSANTNVISQAYYYWNVYNWGGPQYSNSEYSLYIQKNSYIKMREISFGYSLPTNIAGKLMAKNIKLSVFGRNLFYLYRTIKGMDAEQLTAGAMWNQQTTNLGTNPSTRTYGMMLRASF